MKKTKLLRLCLLFLFAILLSNAVSAEMESFTLMIKNIDGEPGEINYIAYQLVDGSVYFYTKDGFGLYYQPKITKTVDGEFKVEYDSAVMGNGDYLISYVCYGPSSYLRSKIFKDITLPVATTYTINCANEEGAPKFNLIIKERYSFCRRGICEKRLRDYSGYYFDMFLKENLGTSFDMNVLEAYGGGLVALNKGWHELLFVRYVLVYVYSIYVDGEDITIVYDPSATLTVNVKTSSGPISSSYVVVFDADHATSFSSMDGVTDESGTIVFENTFITGNYLIEACCQPNTGIYSCPLDKISRKKISFEEGESEKTEEVSCDLVKYPVVVQLKDESGNSITNNLVSVRDPFLNFLITEMSTGNDGEATFELYPGEYEFMSSYKCSSYKRKRFSIIGPNPPMVEMVFPNSDPQQLTVSVKDAITGSAIIGADVVIGTSGSGSYRGITNRDGKFSKNVCPAIYRVGVTCTYIGGASLTYTKYNIDVRGQTNVNLTCGGGKMNVTVIDASSGERFAGQVKLELYFTGNSQYISSSISNPSLFNVLPSTYDIKAIISFNGQQYICRYNSIYVDEDEILPVKIRFKTTGDIGCGELQLPVTSEISAPEFKPPTMFLVIAVLSASFILAFLQSKKVKPGDKQ